MNRNRNNEIISRRINKIVDGLTTAFTYDHSGNIIAQSNGLEFVYDNTEIIGIKYNNITYFYRRNAQGDIIALLDSEGQVMVKYVYDAWGNHSVKNPDGTVNAFATHIGNLNPFRYRGYYYDVETGLYYLKTRYYDPEVGRFITIDDLQYLDPETINGLNLYAYCGNNPIMAVDPEGTKKKWWQKLALIFTIVGAVLVVAAVTVLTAGVGTTGLLAGTLAGAVIHGAAIGALIGAGVGVVAGGLIGGAVSGWTAEGILSGMGIGFGAGAIIGAVIGGTVGGIKFGNFASQDVLDKHFVKHSQEFERFYSSSKEYAKEAKYVIKNGTKVTYTYRGKVTTGYMRFYGAKGGANYAFVGMKGTKVATYSIRGVKELIKLGIAILGL